MRNYLFDVQPFGVEDASLGIAYRNYLHSYLRQELGGNAARISKSLDGSGCFLVVNVPDLTGAAYNVNTTACGRLMPAK